MTEGLVFDIQRFSIHDGPGIRTTVFLKGCPLRCLWCQNPEGLLQHPEMAFYADRCMSAGECYVSCPHGALFPGEQRIIRDRCDACGMCVESCPHTALEVVGRKFSVEALLGEVLRDRPFFQASGGGVTLSGGEPTMQMDFLGAFARACWDERLSVGLQTCGLFQWEALQQHLPYFRFIHFDLKVMDDGEHRQLTGVGNRTILANARHLATSPPRLVFRMPIVPGFTDTDANLDAVACFLLELEATAIHLLPYHGMGQAKLPRIGFPVPTFALDGDATLGESIKRARKYFKTRGIEVNT